MLNWLAELNAGWHVGPITDSFCLLVGYKIKNSTLTNTSLLLSGTTDPSELREYLYGPPLEVEVHDRDRIYEKQKPKPTLFGDDLEDEKISNVGTVSSE